MQKGTVVIMDRTSVIFGNKMPDSVIRKAENSKAKFIKEFGDDSNKTYHYGAKENSVIGHSLGVQELYLTGKDELSLPENAVIIGNIRMGFGHYRISMAMASAAKKLGLLARPVLARGNDLLKDNRQAERIVFARLEDLTEKPYL